MDRPHTVDQIMHRFQGAYVAFDEDNGYKLPCLIREVEPLRSDDDGTVIEAEVELYFPPDTRRSFWATASDLLRDRTIDWGYPELGYRNFPSGATAYFSVHHGGWRQGLRTGSLELVPVDSTYITTGESEQLADYLFNPHYMHPSYLAKKSRRRSGAFHQEYALLYSGRDRHGYHVMHRNKHVGNYYKGVFYISPRTDYTYFDLINYGKVEVLDA